MASTAEEAIDSKPINGAAASEDMELECGSRGIEKREREDVERDGEEKRLKLDEEEERDEEGEKSAEEKRMENTHAVVGVEEKVKLGPKEFASSVEMFDYFFKILHSWSPNLDLNQYEHMVVLDLLKKGHPTPDKKIGDGIQVFQVRYHPLWKSRCFFLIRADGTCDDFSFRKCVDHILPLPENMKLPSVSNGNKSSGGRGGGGGGRGGARGGRGRGRRGGRN